MGIRSIFEKVLGIDQIRKDLNEEIARSMQQAQAAKAEAEAAILEAKAATELKDDAQASAKELATKRGEPWVSVLQTNVNPDNPRNGFFEMDWNQLFIAQLIQHGYGFETDPEEEIVDRWFRDLATDILRESEMPTHVPAGFINFNPISKEHTEVT